MIGDEIMVVSTEGIHDFGSPVLYKPYVVVGLKHRQRENWQGPETDTTYYQIEPIGMTDEERTGAMLAGGGRARPMYIFPSPSEYRGSDQWILRPGFLRGELEEGGETNEAARTLSKARKAGVDTYYPKSAVKANPERFRKYTRDKYLKEEKEINPKLKVGNTIRVIDVDGEHKNMPERFKIYKVVNVSAYDKNNFIYDLVSPDLDLEKVSTFDSRGVPIFHSKNLYRGDTWIKIDRTIKEHDQPGLSPELEIGDVIKVIDIDRERERGKTQYTTPGEQMRPEKFVPYTVVDKKSNGSQSKWFWKYTLVPPNQVEAYEKSLDRGWGNYEGYEKLLYPWIYEWIPADTPMANKVDRLTLTEWEGEHEPIIQKELNPELEKGDHVKIISIDGEHANMPKKWEVYVVNSVHGDKYQNQRHYGLYPMDQTDEQLTSSMLAGGGKRRELYLYRGDEWMKVKNSQLNPLIKKLNGMEIEIDTTKYDLGYVDEETGESTGNLFFEITNPRFSPISYGGDSPVRNDMFHYDLLFTKEESGILVDWFDKEELEKMFNQDGIKGKINKAVYENYLKLYGIPQKYVRVQEILVDNLLLGLDFRNNFVSESYDNEDLCDELTISTEEELREKLEGMSIGKEDRDEIEGLIGNMLSDTEHLHPGLPSVESETDFDISNTYGRKIQSILCTHERKNISNIDEESTILETFEVISDLNKAIVVN